MVSIRRLFGLEPDFQPLDEPSLLALDIPVLIRRTIIGLGSRQPITAPAAEATAAPGIARLLSATTRDQ